MLALGQPASLMTGGSSCVPPLCEQNFKSWIALAFFKHFLYPPPTPSIPPQSPPKVLNTVRQKKNNCAVSYASTIHHASTISSLTDWHV